MWPGKDDFLLSPKDSTGKPVWVSRSHPAASEVRLAAYTGAQGEVDDANPAADNLLFTGDGLDVLRLLAEHPEFRRQYRGEIKCVYIDLPFPRKLACWGLGCGCDLEPGLGDVEAGPVAA